MNNYKKSSLVITSIFLIGVVILAFFPQESIYHHPIISDELLYTHYIGSFRSFFIDHSWDDPLWSNQGAYNAVPFGLYCIGGCLYFSKYKKAVQIPDKEHTELCVSSHLIPNITEVIYFLRQRLLVFRSGTILILCIIALMFKNPFIVFLVPLFLIPHVIFHRFTQFVYIDGIWLFFHFLTFLLQVIFFRLMEKQPHRIVMVSTLALLTGISIGLLSAIKIHGIICYLVFLICTEIYIIIIKIKKLGSSSLYSALLRNFLLVSMGALITFIVVNPALYVHPVEGILKIIRQRINNNMILMTDEPARVLNTFMSRLIYIQYELKSNIIFGFLFLLGFGTTCVKTYQSIKYDRLYISVFLLFIVYAMTLLLVMAFFLRLAFPRYVLVLVPYYYFFVSYGTGITLTLMTTHGKKRL